MINRDTLRVIPDVAEVAGTIPVMDMFVLGEQCS
jgi:hypothetical protein